MASGTTYYPAPGAVAMPWNGYGSMKTAYHTDPASRSMNPITTGTSVLGIKFDGGVAIAADMLGSYGSLARFPGVPRLSKVNPKTVIGFGGDYADGQYLMESLELMMIENDIQDDGIHYTPEAIYSFIRFYLYKRRSDFNPLWNTVVVGGYDKGKSFLGYVDKIGTAYEEDCIGTGFGMHIAVPMMRKALEANPALTQVEAVKLLQDCLKVLFYRDARSINKYEIAVITEDGVAIDSGLSCETNWEIAHLIKGYE